jgi:hypothetical protein
MRSAAESSLKSTAPAALSATICAAVTKSFSKLRRNVAIWNPTSTVPANSSTTTHGTSSSSISLPRIDSPRR